jgi:hypothetical protein
MNSKKKQRIIRNIKQRIIRNIEQIKITRNIKQGIFSNSIYYKNFSKELTIQLNDDNYYLNSSSSSIIFDNTNKQYLLMTRFINYKLNIIGKTICNDKDIIISINILYYLNDSFNFINEKIYYTNDISINTKYKGIEDIRLFYFNNNIYYIGSAYNTQNNRVEIVSDILDLQNNILNKKFISPSFNTKFKTEKNWIFFENNENLYIIYKWFPITICNINYNTQKLNVTKEITNIPEFFKRFRGSTCGVNYDNKIWFIVHFVRNIKGISKPNYLHCFVVFDKQLNMIGYSQPFNFENNLVEYCIGFTLSIKNNFIITYSCLDKTSKLCVFLPSYISSLITYI